MTGKYTAEALVLGVRNWGEADRIVTLFTRERGMVKAAAYGSRRPRSQMASAMQMFHHVEVQLLEGQRLDSVKQCSLLHRYRKLAEDYTAMAYGSFVAEVLQEFLPEGDSDPAVFELLLDIFSAFETRNPRIAALAAAWQILDCAGLQLRLEHCVHCGREITGNGLISVREGGALCSSCGAPDAEALPSAGRDFLRELIQMDWKHPSVQVKRENLLLAEHVLLSYLQSMLGKPLKSLSVIRQIG